MEKVTVGYIDHNRAVFDAFLGPSLDELIGDFEVVFTTDKSKPARNYNDILERSKTDIVILTFPANISAILK